MHDALRLIIAADQAVEMHETRHIESRDHFGAGAGMVLDAVAAHETRDAFFSHGKSAAEAAALVRSRQLNDFNATQLGEKLANLIEGRDHLFGRASEAKFTQAVAAHLDSDLEGKLTLNVDDFSDVSEVLAKLESILAQMFEARFPVKPVIVVIAHHGDAATGGANHVIVLCRRFRGTARPTGGQQRHNPS